MKLIQKHLNNITLKLKSEFETTSISEHGGNRGTARESVVKYFLASNLPSNLDFTSGEVFDSLDERSGQIDIIVHTNYSLKLNYAPDLNMVPVDNVLAVIECKSNLTTGSMTSGSAHLKLALDSCVKCKKLHRINPIGIDSSYLKSRNLPLNALALLEETTGMCGSLANTPHMIIAFKGPEAQTLRDALWRYMSENDVSLEFMPNVITVLDKGYYLVKNDGFYMKKVEGHVHYSECESENSTLLGIYMYLMKLADSQKLSQNFFPVQEYLK
ncbi:DUF6602 domain-containing protein [Shewanella algae]|uniref:DUF6602 domain-containing protein n=1 Tax=Shewanella algae TaxID=38313 RepID=UPI0031F59077